ncbi:ParB N-terminal domain-containing protein [Rhodobacter sp. 24-YEA-8]|uniref:ParB/RepB/Spo0J family partition protein n=1 Tax=Rhodobacter sp. 24-YEA-8 TaxID=1884310 RepID=UPI0008995A35|nr:ParB N-terminal domain-containing protein [Rhodobacter sp. 24-YEA-8]SED91017.1 ParB/RepB/Spo0J family partition protein [Rhodobacter sp. 24-YEA-8]
MARRKRLGPAIIAPETDENSHVSDVSEGVAPEVKAALPPPGAGSFGAPPPIARVAAESAAEAALSEISEAMSRARAEGRLVLRLPLAGIEADHLVRDRIDLDEEDLAGLISSIAEHGQRNPVEVSEIAPGRYGLISGWRRLTALKRLCASGNDRFDHVLALVRKPESAADAYIAMVEENEIRAGLSYYERARIAARAVEQGVFPTERDALRRLFANASRSRRSKIGSFLVLYHHLDPVLRFPSAIPERLGLTLEKRLHDTGSAMLETFLVEMRDDPSVDAATEQDRLSRFASADVGAPPAPVVGIGAKNVSRAKHSEHDALPQAQGQELRPGILLAEKGGAGQTVLVLSGPGISPEFRARLEEWLASES